VLYRFLKQSKVNQWHEIQAKKLERLPTSEFCLYKWHYLRKDIYFLTNVLSRQKRIK